MKNKTLLKIAGIIGLFTILTSWDSYRIQNLAAVLSQAPSFADEDRGVDVFAKAYTKEESERYLNRNVPGLGYQPIQVIVQNKTGDTYILSTDGIDLPVVKSKEVVGKVLKKAIPRSIGLKIAGLFFWPLLIPDAINSIVTMKMQASLRKDLAAKTINEDLIPSYSTINRVFFVKTEDYRENFVITLKELQKETPMVFEMHPPKPEEPSEGQ